MSVVQALAKIPSERADRLFMIDGESGVRFSYGETHAVACGIGSYLRARGVRRGDRVVLILNSSVDFAFLYFGCLAAGVVAVPVNPLHGEALARYVVAHSGAGLIFTSRDVVGSWKSPPGGEFVYVKGSPGAEASDLDVRRLPSAPDFKAYEGLRDEDEMAVVYTSGTTADPKGVVHRVAGMVGNGLAFIEFMGLGPENRFLNILPMAYLGGYYNLLLIPYLAGGSVVVRKAFSTRDMLDFWTPVEKFEVDTLWLVPSIMAMLMELDRSAAGPRYGRRKVRLGLVGTAPLPRSLAAAFEARYGFRLWENYGLSETFFLCSASPRFASSSGVGRLLPGVEMRILDEAGRDVPQGGDGEISVRSPFMMDGYYDSGAGRPVRQAGDGWFMTGDIGRISPAGDVEITGRKKDLIIRGGVNISPAAVEGVILRHSGVREAAVVGVEHPVMGEEVVAVVRSADDRDFEELKADLGRLCAEHLPAIQRPAHYLRRPDFPRNPSGKVQKNLIRGWAAGELRAARG